MIFRDLLKKYNLKQLDVANKLGIDPRHINRYDNLRKRSIEEVILIHDVTNIPYIELIGTELKD